MKTGRFGKANLFLLLVSLVVSVLALEFLCRYFIFDPNQSYIRTPGWRMAVRTNDLIPFVTGDHDVIVNRYGYRGALPSPIANPFVVVIGGSTVEDWVLSEPETWPEQLQSQLRDCAPDVEVANLGKGGANARHNLMQLEAASNYLPKVDIYVVLMGLNDFLFDLRIHHSFEVPEDWWRRQAFMTVAGEEGRSALVAITKRLYRLWVNRNSGHKPISNFGHYQQALRDAKANVSPDQWVDVLPDFSEHLQTYRTTIRKLKDFADKQGAEIFFATQPYLWSSDMSAEAEAQIYAGFIGSDMNSPSTKWFTPRALEQGLRTYNNTLRKACDEEQLNCIELAGQLPRRASTFYDDFHFSEAGAAAAGEIVASALRGTAVSCRP